MLPDIPYKDGAARIPVMQFGGLERREAGGNGTICDMLNLTGADAPVLSSRPKRKTAATLTNPRGIYGCGTQLFYVEADRLYKDGAPYDGSMPGAANDERVFATMGNRLLVWPDKRLYQTDGTSQSQLGTYTNRVCYFEDGTYAGEPAEKNTIRAKDSTHRWTNFKVGDAVMITCNTIPANNKTAIIREIDNDKLRFYENTFTTNSTVGGGGNQVNIERVIPDLDFICVNDNRVWGCKGDTICCCKLGDPTNWNVFDGLSTDSWSVETGTPGDFTACISFMGYPIFFKEDTVFKVYGSRPSNFEVMSSATLGVLDGAAKTMAVAGETLYYLSRAGFVRYNGGYPSAIDAALNAKYTGGAAGSDGKKYYVSAVRSDNTREFLVYDPDTGIWIKEDALAVKGFANIGNTLYAQTEGANVIVAGAANPDESGFDSSVTFDDFDSVTVGRSVYSFASKYPVRLWLRYACEARNVTENSVTTDIAALTVQISYNGGAFESVTTLPSTQKAAKYIPVPIRRCDRFRVKLSCNSAWKLYGMQIETRAERTNRKGG